MRRRLAVLAVLSAVVAGAWNCTGVDPNVAIDCSLDDGPYTDCPNLVQDDGKPTGSLLYDDLAEGMHIVTIRGRMMCGRNPDGTESYGPEAATSWVWDHDPAEPAAITFEVKPGRC